MIKWYADEKLGIFFNDIPYVSIRYVLPSMSEIERKSIKKYPFINKRKLSVKLFDNIKMKSYAFIIPKGYCFDGASIPWLFRRIIGAPTDNSFLIAALVHDVLCENHKYVNFDRAFSTEVFNALLIPARVNKVKRFLMKHAINIFQKYFCNWSK